MNTLNSQPSTLLTFFMSTTPTLLSANELALAYGYQRLLDGVTLTRGAGREGRAGGPERLRQDQPAEDPGRA